MKSSLLASVIFMSAAMAVMPVSAQTTNQYPFQNPAMALEDRVDNIISLMTQQEKVAFLSSRPGVPRLGIRGSGQVEGLHGLQNSGTGGAGRRRSEGRRVGKEGRARWW